MIKRRLSFLWDYDLDQKEVKKALKQDNEFTRHWLVTRILESAKYNDIWKYLTLKDLTKIFPKLKLKRPVEEAWQKAFKAWGIA